jgi:hypothetical protein
MSLKGVRLAVHPGGLNGPEIAAALGIEALGRCSLRPALNAANKLKSPFNLGVTSLFIVATATINPDNLLKI